MRDSLDPLGLHSEAELQAALERCRLPAVAGASGRRVTLNSRVGPRGGNWSAGEQQLLILGRALLKCVRGAGKG